MAGVYVGRPAVLGSRRGRPVYSGIVKHPVAAAELALTEVNLDGDEQADLSVHGGPDKAVYSYPAEHYPGWRAEPEPYELYPGMVGENVSTSGADEWSVRIGDRWAWGTAVVEVSQPRSPCYKLAMRVGRQEMIAAMLRTGRCGWYLRVARTGRVPTEGPMTLVERDESAPTVGEVYLAANVRAGELDPGQHRRLLERAVRAPALAEGWRHGLGAKLARLS
ncbi:MOSC domain-containing protein [Pseudonocardia acaciae]|uniref:MOSC domain-containing protein n=1 Tax=Pseudonocardia acaciae TaxID=551276 RepID=UPI00316AEA3F